MCVCTFWFASTVGIVAKSNEFHPFQFWPSIIVHGNRCIIKTLILIHFFPDLHIPHTPHPEDCRRTEKRIEQNQIEFKNDNFIIWRYTKLRCWLPHHWMICSTRSNIYLSEWYFRSERLFIKATRSVNGLLRTFPLPQSISTTRIVINCLVWSIHVQHIHMSFYSLNVRCCHWFHSSLLLLHQFLGVTSTIIQ